MKSLIERFSILGDCVPEIRSVPTSLLKRLARSGALLACLCISAHAQTNEWTWMGGSAVGFCPPCGVAGVYGTLRTAAPGNNPGSRWPAATWTDGSGNFWLFGGQGWANGGFVTLNDLWKFTPSTNEWTWMGGSSTPNQPGMYGVMGTPANGNMPGSRELATGWVDSSGNFWLYGGGGYDANGDFGLLNDLWEFDPSTSRWAWISGNSTVGSNCAVITGTSYCGRSGVYGMLGTPAAANVPGGRQGASSWADGSGNFWVFGGLYFDSNNIWGDSNELWRFSPSTNEWTWMSGSNTVPGIAHEQLGIYGTLGTPAAGNVPGGRQSASTWTDSGGNLWLLGGNGAAAATNAYPYGDLNDRWEFNPFTAEWAWMGGSDAPSQPGVYGTLGSPAMGNLPGGRSLASIWADKSGNIWLFGGIQNIQLGIALFNDLWELNPFTNEWTWMAGSNTSNQPGVYGTLGTPAAGNTPGSRFAASSWIDESGDLWLYGGEENGIYPNDLWEYQPSPPQPQAAAPTFSLAAGTYITTQTVTISDATNGATIYYTTDGTAPTTGSAVYSGSITVSSTEIIEATAAEGGHSASAIATAAYTITPPAAPPTFSPAAGTYTSAQTVTISDTTAGATIYYTTDGTAPTINSTVYTGAITVSLTQTIQAIATATGYSQSAVATAAYTITPTFAITGTAVSVAPGASTGNTSTITVAPAYGFVGAVTLSCAITPVAASDPATCSLPASVTISGSASQTTTLTVSTTAAASALNRPNTLFRNWAGGSVFACVLLIGISTRRRRYRTSLGLIILLFFIAGVSACGGGGNASGGGGGGGGNPGTTPGTYTITVTGTSGTITQSGKVSLTVQ